jgi:hypothetical protein
MEAIFQQIANPESSGRVMRFDLPLLVRQSTSPPLTPKKTI